MRIRCMLMSIGTDHKTVKGEKFGYLTAINYLAPHRIAGVGNVCPHASHGCAKACLYTAGRGIMANVQNGRIRKTRLFFSDRLEYLRQIHYDLETLQSVAHFRRMVPCARLNGTSDLPWERFGVMEKHPELQFYDYTKNPVRMHAYLDGRMPRNYHLTFSRSEANEPECLRVLGAGGNVAVVFGGELPSEWNGYPVVSGDESDLRFLDGTNVVVGLRAKGRARHDNSGFVVNNK